jgi:lipoprotein-releasing system ATP-binding protein
MTKSLILSVIGLIKDFGEGETQVHVLKDIDLSMEAGEMAALLGPSGSGKSTLLTILGTLMRASGGTHEMLGVDLMHASEAQRTEFRSKNLGFVFQFHHLLPDLSALENVMMPAACAAGRCRSVGSPKLPPCGNVRWPTPARCRGACADQQSDAGSGR